MVSDKLMVVKDERFITKKGLCAPLGSKIMMDEVYFAMGGCGANAAATFSRQGLKTACFSQIGKDCSGELVKDVLTKNGVSLDLLKKTDKYPTAYSIILSLPDIDRSILEKIGACHYLTEKDMPFDDLKAKWFYVASLSGDSSRIFKPLIDCAGQKGIKLAVNPGKNQLKEDLKITRSLLNKMDILIVNQEEASQLAGVDFSREKEIFEKLDKMVEGIVVMSKGPAGVAVSDGKTIYSAGIPESGMVDRTGAGDAFGSAFVAGWIEKGDIVYAIQLGAANATACIQEFGATNGLLKKGEWGRWERVEVKKEKIREG